MTSEIIQGWIPKYRQLLIILRNKILKGDLAPGERIPSEEDLINTYGLSRGTVRKAISQLEQERLIDTEHGVGSFVRALHPNAVPFQFVPVSAADSTPGDSYYEVLAQESIPAPMAVAEKLKIDPGTPVIHIARRKLTSGQAVSYSERYLQENILPSLLKADLTRVGSIHDMLVGSSEYPLLRAEIEIEAHLISEQEAHLLQALPGESVIVVNRITYTAPNKPAVLYTGLFRNEYHISIKATGL
jgi:GntR family transcriptional regulator